MIEVEVKEGENLDRALRRYKKKYERIGILKQLRARKYHTQKSVERREQVRRAARRDKYLRDHSI